MVFLPSSLPSTSKVEAPPGLVGGRRDGGGIPNLQEKKILQKRATLK